jgi:hypothetical protein
MKTFIQLTEKHTNPDIIDKLKHPIKLDAKRLEQLKGDYSAYEDIAFEQWQGYPFPKNSSNQTFNELKTLMSLGQFRTEWEEEMIMYDTKVLKPFKDYAETYGIEVDFTRIKSLMEQTQPILLALKGFYNRPRPSVLAKKLGLSMTFFPLKTSKTPSYPSGHATQGHLVSLLVADELPLEHRRNVLKIGKRIGESRQIAGAHYPSDTAFGIELGDEFYRLSKTSVGQEPELELESIMSKLKENDMINEETVVAINDTLPKSATDRTEIYEGCAIVAGMNKGLKILNHSEFSPTCKTWINDFVENVEGGDKIILDYCNELGSAMKQIGPFKDFIHKNINNYYNNAPSIFEVQNPDKVNTADSVMITKGSSSDLFKIMAELKVLDKSGQHARIKTEGSKVSLLDNKDKIVVSYYQVSLKKDAKAGSARIGKVGSFASTRFANNLSLNQPDKILQSNEIFDNEAEGDLLAEGIRDIFNKGTQVLSKLGISISKGATAFLSKIKNVFSKLATSAYKFAASFANKEIKSNKLVKAANAIASELKSDGALLEGVREIKAKKGLVKQIKVFNDAMKGDLINKAFQENKSLASSLNSKFAVKDRPIDPIVVLEGGDVKISSDDLQKLKELNNIKEGDTITLGLGSPVDTVFKLTSNWAGMTYIKGILKYVEGKMSNYENLSSSLYALAAEFEGEARFGNTALPLVIVYGSNTIKHMGTRDDFEKKKVEDLAKLGKEYNDFPVLVIKINKVAGKSYNTINILLVESLTGMPPKPQWMSVGIATNSGSSFATKFEVNTTTKNWKGNIR